MNLNSINNKVGRVDLDSEIWGSKGWFFLDSVALGYPDNPTEEDKQQYKNFFYAFTTVVPCNKCRYHFKQFIDKYPLNSKILKSKDNLILWILTAHNNVNKINGKKPIILDEFYKYYNKIYKTDVKINTCKDKCKLTNLPNNFMKSDNKNQSSTDYKFISILLFGIIIALNLYIYRVMQLKIK